MQTENRDLSRRRLLTGAGATAATLASGQFTAIAARTSKLRFGFTTYQWGSEWDIPTLIANCTQAKAFGVEVRTSAKYKHGIEPDISESRRREVKRLFADSPVKVIGIASAARFDSPDPAVLKAAIEDAKAHVKLSSDVGATGVRVFPNDFHKEVPQERTIAQISRSLNELGKFAAGYGQMVRLENHGTAGRLVTLHKVMAMVDEKNVRIKLNGDGRDAEGGAFAQNFALVKNHLGDTLHMHELNGDRFPYQLQFDLLIDAGWEGWCFVEASAKVPDRFQALLEQKRIWDGMIAKSLARS